MSKRFSSYANRLSSMYGPYSLKPDMQIKPLPGIESNMGNKATKGSDSVLTLDSPLGKQFLEAKAKVFGNENLFPAVTPNGEMYAVTYQLRHFLTKCVDTPLSALNGRTYRHAMEQPNLYYWFWEEMELKGPLLHWGTAAIPVSGNSVLLSRKLPDAVTYAGLTGIPAGIVDIDDFLEHETLLTTLMYAAGRELYEETGADIDLLHPRHIDHIEVVWDKERCKPQFFARFQYSLEILQEIKKGIPLEKEFLEWDITTFSPEGLFALEMLYK